MIKLFADTANLQEIVRLNKDPRVSGFTTNPTLTRKAGVTDYLGFCKAVLAEVTDKPVNLMVLGARIWDEAKLLASLAGNVVVKVPVIGAHGGYLRDTIKDLASQGVPLNATAVMNPQDVEGVAPFCDYVSVFAGRIADTGRDPLPLMRDCLKAAAGTMCQVIWASPREVYNYYQARDVGCDAITMAPDLIDKLSLENKGLTMFSLETAKMFEVDGRSYEIL